MPLDNAMQPLSHGTRKKKTAVFDVLKIEKAGNASRTRDILDGNEMLYH